MKTDVVIPHYGPDEDLVECLRSLDLEFENFEEVPAYGWYLEADHPDIANVVIVDNNKENRGFSKGVNVGIEMCLKDSDIFQNPYVMIVNNDTTMRTGSIRNMIHLTEDKSCGIVGPKIVDHSNVDQIVHAGGEQCFPNGVHRGGLVSLGDHNEPCKVKWLSFVVVMIHKSVFTRIGLLDEKMFLVGSDSDFCYRLRYAGFDCWYCPDNVWTHKIGESGNPTSDASIKIQRKDMWYFHKKWLSGKAFVELDTEVVA